MRSRSKPAWILGAVAALALASAAARADPAPSSPHGAAARSLSQASPLRHKPPRRAAAARRAEHRALLVRRVRPVYAEPSIILDVPQRTRDEDFLLDGTLMELFARVAR